MIRLRVVVILVSLGIFSQLADQFRVTYFDYRGRGRSEPNEGAGAVTFADDVADLEGLRAALGLEHMAL